MKHSPIPQGTSRGLVVRVVDTPDGLEALRPAWERLEARDLAGSLFLSYAWLSQAFRRNPFRWSVLAVHAAGDPAHVLGLLPLKLRAHWSRSRGEFHTELEAGGRLLWSEYTGFLCDPEHENPVLEAMAEELMRLPWTRLSMRYVAQPRRLRSFAEALGDRGCTVRFRDYRINGGQTDNLVCPQIDLPDSFAGYLAEQVSANQRQKYRKLKRQTLETGSHRITHMTAETFEKDLDATLALWVAKWQQDKGLDRARRVAANYRETLIAAHRLGRLYLPVLWHEGARIGALAHIVDEHNGVLHFILAARALDAGDVATGPLLHFHSIGWAIENGFICYDFGHGDEAYKFSYGAAPHPVDYLDIRRPAEDPALVLDPLCTGEVLRRIEGFLKDGKTDRAIRACAQLSKLLS